MDLPQPIIEVIFLLQGRKEDKVVKCNIKEQFPKSFNDSGVVKNVHMFCFPNDWHISPKRAPYWRYHNFVLTNHLGTRLFGHCLRFPLDENGATGAFCALSKDCYYITMQHLLTHVWSMRKNSLNSAYSVQNISENSQNDDTWFSEELTKLVHCVVCPQSKDLQLRLTLTGNFPLANRFQSTQTVHYRYGTPSSPQTSISFLFGQPGQNTTRFPIIDFKLSILFTCLSVPNVILLWCSLLSESKIVLVSNTVAVLAHVTQGLITLLWPFTWQHVFIPLLPDSMLDFLTAPTPFIMGLVRKDDTEFDLDEDAIFVDLDKNVIKRGPIHVAAKIPPVVELQLEEELNSILRPEFSGVNYAVPSAPVLFNNDSDLAATEFYNNHPEADYNRSIQIAFFTAWRRLFNGWNFGSIAEINQYITEWVPPQHQGFYQAFCATQSFDTFHRTWLTDTNELETEIVNSAKSGNAPSHQLVTAVRNRSSRTGSFSAPKGIAASPPTQIRKSVPTKQNNSNLTAHPSSVSSPHLLSPSQKAPQLLSVSTPPVATSSTGHNYPYVVKVLVSLSPYEEIDSLYFRPSLILEFPKIEFPKLTNGQNSTIVPIISTSAPAQSTPTEKSATITSKTDPNLSLSLPSSVSSPVLSLSSSSSNSSLPTLSTIAPSVHPLLNVTGCDELSKYLPQIYDNLIQYLQQNLRKYYQPNFNLKAATATSTTTTTTTTATTVTTSATTNLKRQEESRKRARSRIGGTAAVHDVNIHLLLVHFRLKCKQNVETLSHLTEIILLDPKNPSVNNDELFDKIFTDIHEQYKDDQLQNVIATIKSMPGPVSSRLMDYLDKSNAELWEKLQRNLEKELRKKVEQLRINQNSQKIISKQQSDDQKRKLKHKSKIYGFIATLDIPKIDDATNNTTVTPTSPKLNLSSSTGGSDRSPKNTVADPFSAVVDTAAFIEWAIHSGISLTHRSAENLYHSLHPKVGIKPLRLRKIQKFIISLQKCHSHLLALSRQLSTHLEILSSPAVRSTQMPTDLDPILAAIGAETSSTFSPRDETEIKEFILLHQAGVFHNNTRGHLLLTTLGLLFIPQRSSIGKHASEIYIPITGIHDIEKFNYKVVIPPGVPCIRVILNKEKQGIKQEEIFYLLTNRSFWYFCMKEILSGYTISRDLTDDSFILESGLNVLLAQAVEELSRERAHLLFRLEEEINGYGRIFKTIQDIGILNNADCTKKPGDGCELVVELLLSALHLFFSYTQHNHKHHGLSAKSSPLLNFIRPQKLSPKLVMQSSANLSPTFPRENKHENKHENVNTGDDSSGHSGSGASGNSSSHETITIDLEKLRKSTEFAEFSKATAELQYLDLSDLTDAQRSAFFINVYNLLVIHGYVHVGFPTSLLEWRYFSRFICYSIGGFPYTLDCIHRLLRGRTAKVTSVGDYALSVDDPRSMFYLPKSDPRIHFLLCLHSTSSPPIRVAFPDTMEFRLAEAATDYCQKHVEVDVDQNRIVLPAVFDWFRPDFESDGNSDPALQATSSPKLRNFLTNIAGVECVQWLSEDQKRKITSIIGKADISSVDIAYKYDWTPNPTPPI